MESLTSVDPRRIGPYRSLARLGAGGMGRVYLARSPDGHLCALKVVKEDLAHDTDFRARFAREVRVAQRVRGPFTPAVVDAAPDASIPWMATEYVAGPTLAEAVTAGGPFREPSLSILTLGLTRALAAVHDVGLVHRDLKPGNVLLSPRGPQVIDFGIAKAVEGTVLTRTGQAFGTPAYISPELVTGADATPRSDVFSLAGTVVFAALGRPPFPIVSVGGGPADRRAQVLRSVLSGEPRLDALPEGPLRALLARCLAKDPRERPDTAEIEHELSSMSLTPAEHGWLPPLVTDQIELRAEESRRTQEADGTTDSQEKGSRRPWWRRRATLAATAAATAVAVAGACTLVFTGLPFGTHETPGGPTSTHPSAEATSPSEPDLSSVRLNPPYDMGFSADGQTLYVFDLELSAWDWNEGEPVDRYEPAPRNTGFGAGGHILAVYDDRVQMWDGDSTTVPSSFTGERESETDGRIFQYGTPAITDDGTTFAVTAAEDGRPYKGEVVQIWDVRAGEVTAEIQLDEAVRELRFTPDGSLLLGWEHGEFEPAAVHVWAVDTGDPVHRIDGGYRPKIALSPDSRTMVLLYQAENSDTSYRLIDLDTGQLSGRLADLDKNNVCDLAYSADGSSVYAAPCLHLDGLGSVWDAETGQVTQTDLPLFYPLALHPDGEHIATMARDHRMLVLDSDLDVVTEFT
ncbi:serine/threonine-protein kinase [Nocardiopsis sp. EMB25]|uniref:WD40 repeat domain-containing serine/threonine protein kinase n=1 Tax=Nocardiopsis sp. EMB25 TaxID=2835867 RepID=UPI002285382C|nr:serine/threonine-protein kinase [Nocardiopsis sp. EMB25]MCY9784186.1 serine/threonine-protein kinase [Nocardiopsis sp. EMB25]